MHHFTSRTAITFRTIQGLTTLLDQQQAALVGLVAFLMEDVGVTGPFIVEAIANLNASSHVISGYYAVPLSYVYEFISGLASWVDSIVDEANEGQLNELFNDIAFVYVTACNRISKLSTYRDENNNPLADPSSFPPVLPTSSSNYPLLSLFARCAVTTTNWSSVIRVNKLTLSPTSTSSCSMLTGLSKSSSRASMRCLINQPSRMGGVYLVADSRT